MGIELIQDGILLTLRIDNRTPYRIGEVFFPQLGGLQGLGKTAEQLKATRLNRPTGADAVASTDIFRTFVNMSWLGDQGRGAVLFVPQGRAATVDRIPRTATEAFRLSWGV